MTVNEFIDSSTNSIDALVCIDLELLGGFANGSSFGDFNFLVFVFKCYFGHTRNSRIAGVSDSQKWGFILIHYVLLWQLRWILKEDRAEKDRNSLSVKWHEENT